MILVRDIFQLKFGKAREAMDLMKQGIAMMKESGFTPDRVLTDLSGTFYTLVLESTYDNLTQYENTFKSATNDEWRKWYLKFTELVQSGSREIFNIVTVPETTRASTERSYAGAQTR
jgi:hypothetical protein